MNTTAAQMQNSAGRFSELRSRLFFVLGAFFVYRVGAHIPVPGVDP
ncbi:MAG: preprotein translocase subunit SecY, partial [Methylococcales bacterium]|nr:preprotein translocase subunit SecY [Methylococcales bacterium]MBT4664143.1 preprotein translocase subunit SecY [Methylococcales bacterium]MBT6524088.1 preprotein translocase subunit SecY [Methylococcales bacterium]